MSMVQVFKGKNKHGPVDVVWMKHFPLATQLAE
jgi:hypothetical protein